MWCFCLCIMDYYSALKKKEILPSVIAQVDREGIMLTEIHQPEKDKNCMQYKGIRQAGLKTPSSSIISCFLVEVRRVCI